MDRAKFSASAVPKEDKFAVFDAWLKEHGAVYPSVALREYANGACRGVLALEHIPAQSTVIAIPHQLLITDAMGRSQCESGRLVFASRCELSMPHLIAVVLYILDTRADPTCFFKPYYDVLPVDWSDFPVFWSEEQLDTWLHGSPLVNDVRERRATIRADYDAVCRVVSGFADKHAFRDFLAVRTAVGSRNFGIVVDGEKRTSMIPLADMLNHFRPRETSWCFDNVKRCFVINSLRDLEPGQQVLDSYGRKDNSRFLLHYGFAVENNREDDGRCQNELMVMLKIVPSAPVVASNGIGGSSTGVGDNDPLASVKRAFLGTSRSTRKIKVSMNRDDRGTSEALAFARIMAATETDLQVLLARASLLHSSASKFISPRNEEAALRAIAQAMRDALARYSRSLEDNVNTLRALPSFGAQRSALVVIVGEQQVAHFWIGAHETLKDALLQPSRLAVMRALANLPSRTPEELDLFRYATWLVACMQGSEDADD